MTKTSIVKPHENMIYYSEWKEGRSILTTSQLYKALEYAKQCKEFDIEWLLKEIAKRNVTRTVTYYN